MDGLYPLLGAACIAAFIIGLNWHQLLRAPSGTDANVSNPATTGKGR
jgi:hypothetical protein